MISRLAILALAPVAIAAVPVVASAQESGEGAWLRSVAADRSYSVETPCTAVEVAEYSAGPNIVNDQALDDGTNVVCVVGESIFSTGVLSISVEEIGDANLFDEVLVGLEQEDVRDEVSVTVTRIEGRRAIVSRERRGEEVAQTGVIELSNRELLMLVSGGTPPANRDMAAMIDRHFASLKVASK